MGETMDQIPAAESDDATAALYEVEQQMSEPGSSSPASHGDDMRLITKDMQLIKLEKIAGAARLAAMVAKGTDGEFTAAYWRKLADAHDSEAAWKDAAGDTAAHKAALFKAMTCARLAEACLIVAHTDPSSPAYWGGVRAFFEACKQVAYPTDWLVSEIAKHAGRMEYLCAEAPFVKTAVSLFGARYYCQMCDNAHSGGVSWLTQAGCMRHIRECHHASEAVARRHAGCIPNVTTGLFRACGLCESEGGGRNLVEHLANAHQIFPKTAAAECERMYSDDLQACLAQVGPDLVAISRHLDVGWP